MASRQREAIFISGSASSRGPFFVRWNVPEDESTDTPAETVANYQDQQETETSEEQSGASGKDPLGECRNCPQWAEIKERARVAVLVNQAVNKYEQKLNANNFRPTIAEYLKLLQLEKEIEDGMEDGERSAEWTGSNANPEK
jgi:hypothetical protein